MFTTCQRYSDVTGEDMDPNGIGSQVEAKTENSEPFKIRVACAGEKKKKSEKRIRNK